jgi:hypothetical protein
MESQQQYDICLHLVKQYEILQKEAKEIRNSGQT